LTVLSRRPVTGEDRPLLFEIYASTRAEELKLVPWTAEQKLAFVRQQFEAQDSYYREHYRDTTWEVVLADGVPAGRLYVARWPEEIRVIDIALLPAHRGRGLGTRLLTEVFDEARSAGKPVRIHVEVMNPARALYERLGFRQVADQGVYLMMEWNASPTGGAP